MPGVLTQPHGEGGAEARVPLPERVSWPVRREQRGGGDHIRRPGRVRVVWARTGGPGARGISAFLVPLDLPGITTGVFEDIGVRAAGRGWLHLDGERIPASHRLGAEGQGFVQVMQGFDYSRALIGLQCLAVARLSLAETWISAAERTSFGSPLTAHQGVAFPLAEAETHVHACRLMCLPTLCLLINGHGAYSTEMPYEQRLRDVLGLQIGDGTAQIMKLVIALRKAGWKAVP